MARPGGRTLSPAYARKPVAPRLDRGDHPRLPYLVADRTCPSLLHNREQKNGLLESPPGSLAEQDGADAVEDGAHARPHGARRLPLRSALEWQPRLRRISHGDAAAP